MRAASCSEPRDGRLSAVDCFVVVVHTPTHKPIAYILQGMRGGPQWVDVAAVLGAGCISTPNVVRHDICRHNYALERGLVGDFCAQPHYCYRPYYPTARFPSPSSPSVNGTEMAYYLLMCR